MKRLKALAVLIGVLMGVVGSSFASNYAIDSDSTSVQKLVAVTVVTNSINADTFTFYIDPVLSKAFFGSSGITNHTSSIPSGKVVISGAVDGEFVALTLRNSQAQDAGTNETVRLDMTWADGSGNVAAGSAIVAGKLGDYSSGATADSYLSFYTSNNNNVVERVNIDDNGYVTIDVDGTMNSGDHHLEIRNGATYSEIDAGETSFTNTSTRTMKENFVTVTADDIRDAFLNLSVKRYNFKPSAFVRQDSILSWSIDTTFAPLKRKVVLRKKIQDEQMRAQRSATKTKVSVMAEDFYPIAKALRPAQADSSEISGDDQIAALILMVQDLYAKNKVLEGAVDSLRALH